MNPKVLIGAILLIIAMITVSIVARHHDEAQQRAFCKRWLQGVSASDSLRLYRGRPDCFIRAEDL